MGLEILENGMKSHDNILGYKMGEFLIKYVGKGELNLKSWLEGNKFL